MLGFITDYITPYALALKATTGQVGVLSASPNFASSLVQLKSADLAEKFRSRKKVINFFVLLHTLMLLPVVFLPYLVKARPVLFLIIFITLFNSLNAVAGPMWLSLMSDHIPVRSRGKYFGWRNKVLGIVAISCAFISGFILHWFKNNILTGFALIFSLAFICRFVSWCFLTRMFDPALKITAEARFTFFDFIGRIRESNFARFVIFVASLNFCVNMASPFFSVYMLRDLKLNYLVYTVIVTSVAIAQILSIDRWGRLADHAGNIKILKLTSLFVASLPFLWLLGRHPAYFIVIQLFAGFVWSGFNLCATNFIYDAVTPVKRIRCIGYFNFLSGLALCCGALLGGYLANVLPNIFGYRLLTLFLISSILRFSVVLFFRGRIKEVRKTQAVASRDLFYSAIGIRPVLTAAPGLQQLKEE